MALAHSPDVGLEPTGSRVPRILIVDDSAVARAVMERIVLATGRYAVAASVSSVAAAFTVLACQRVDIVLLDIHLPDVDGLTALPELLVAGKGARVLVVSTTADDGSAKSLLARSLGAVDTLFKPAAGQRLHGFADTLVDKLDRLSDIDVATAPLPEMAAPSPVGAAHPPRPTLALLPPVGTSVAADYDVVAIGASTGGIHALSELLRAIPPSFRLPILVTQHLPAAFMPYFAAQLAVIGGRPCEVATDRLRLRAGHIVVAPGDAHIRCVRLGDGSVALRLSAVPSRSGCMPSVDPMLDSMAQAFGARMVAVVLSGMGRDGVEGARAVRDAGGCVMVQDQASSVVWGMPGAVVQAGLADAVLPPDAIGAIVAAGRRP